MAQDSSARSLFLLEEGLVFLNHGSFGARPREVAAAQEALRREMEANPVEFLGRRSSALLESALASLGAYLGSDPACLAFVPNATTAVNIAARSVPLGPGDEVLGTDHEYGACALAMRRACAARGAAYRTLSVPLPWRGDADFLSRLEDALGERTRLLYLSQVTSPTALRFPVEEACRLARSRGIVTVVDGAHAPGQLSLDLDALGADFYAGNCHKWMCAPVGSGFLRVERTFHESLDPLVASWGLVADEECGPAGISPHDAYAGRSALARRLQWQGTRDISAFLAVPAAIDFLSRHDGPGVAAGCASLAEDCAARCAALLGREPVSPQGSGLRMALVPLPPCEGTVLKRLLFERFRIEVPVTGHGDAAFLRVSFHLYNTEADIQALLGALEALFPGGKACAEIGAA